MLTEPVTFFFKFVIGRFEFFVKAFLTFSQNDHHHFRVSIIQLHTGHKSNFTCILQLLDSFLFLKLSQNPIFQT